MKKLLLLKSLLLLCALVVGSGQAWALEQVYKTLTFCNAGIDSNKTNDYTSSWTETVGTDNWTITNFNNNNWGWADGTYKLIKCGRKQAGSPKTNTPSVATITTDAAIDEAITKIVVTLTAINASDYNSIKLYMASNDAFDENLETFNVSPIPTSAGAMTITVPEAKRAANRFYKVEFDTKGSTGSNGHTAVKKVEYYYDYVTAATLDHITLSGTYPTEFYVGDAFSHDGMTVTAHYDDSSTADVTGSATFTGYNMSTASDQTVTVSYTEGGTTKTATYGITVTPAPTAVVTLDFTSNDWGISASPTKTVDATEFTSGGYTITLEGSADNGYYFDTNNIMLGKSGATLTLPAFGFNVSKIKVHGTSGASGSVKFNIYVGEDAVSTEATSSKVDHEFAIAAEKQDVGTIYVIKVTSADNMRITKIEVFGNGCEAGLVQSYGWATYITTSDVEYPANTAYVVTDASVSTGLTLAEVTQVPSGTPLLLKGAGAKTAIKLDVTPSAPATNLLTVSNGSALSAGSYPYVLAKNGDGACFKQWTGAMSTLNGRVMLVLDESVATARGIFELDDETTGVAEVRSKMTDGRSEYFNLAGQRVAQPTKGLYIVNGKKVIIK